MRPPEPWPDPPPPPTPGQIAYEAYCGHTEWKSLVSGAPLPQWSEVKPEIKAAWEGAADAVAGWVHAAVRRALGMREEKGPLKSVCICGSSRFCDLAAVKAWEFEKQGILALGMCFLPEWYHEETNKMDRNHYAEQEGVAHILDELHLRKIELADEVFVVNPPIEGHPNGYIGERTRTEIDYALKLGKPVKYLTPQ